MENSLKQRIVGAIVLIALAVIFLPSVLKEKENQAPFQSKIPAKPIEIIEEKISEEINKKNRQTQSELDKLDIRTAERKSKQTNPPAETNIANNSLKTVSSNDKALTENSVKDEGDDKKSTKKISDSSKSQLTKNDTMELQDEDPIATISKQFDQAAWVIQIASFSNKKNALSFVEKLRAAKHKAYYRTNTASQDKQLYRIFVGPYITKQKAELSLAKVNKVSSLSGIILAFDPIKH